MIRKTFFSVITAALVAVGCGTGYAWTGSVEAFNHPQELKWSNYPYPFNYSITVPEYWIEGDPSPSKWDQAKIWLTIEHKFVNRNSWRICVNGTSVGTLSFSGSAPVTDRFLLPSKVKNQILASNWGRWEEDTLVAVMLRPSNRGMATIVSSRLEITTPDYVYPSKYCATDGAPVPEPATMLLLGTGLTSLFIARRRKKTA